MLKKNQHVIDHIRRYRFTFWLVIFTGLLNNIVSFLLPVSIGEFFTIFFHTGSTKGKLLSWMGIDLTTVTQFFLFFCVLIILKAIFTFAENYGTFRQGELFVKQIREAVFSTQMWWSAASSLDRSYGKYLLRYSNDLKSVQNYLTKGYIDGIRSSLFLITGLLVMLKINWELTLLLSFLLILVVVLVYRLAQWQTRFIVDSRSTRSSLLAYVARRFSGFLKLKARQGEQDAIDSFYEKSGILFQANMKYNISESVLISIVPVLIFTIIGTLLWRMIFLPGSITASEGLMLVLILLMMEGGIRRVLKVPTYLNKGKISLQKISKLYDEPNPGHQRIQPIKLNVGI
ncbi:MAG: ABC transporter ATP-binding protein [Saprospiraceae bacterium]|uniref:ABC transporter ATP-binding protein n=1 Tax=Candidatus Opimibacter skivensis TaxID=2982028 RepID=A0A9D7SRZ5_9BACT|nr:ABC transporter ATP-binding protein [Candidatus Opimibacter skivensis]